MNNLYCSHEKYCIVTKIINNTVFIEHLVHVQHTLHCTLLLGNIFLKSESKILLLPIKNLEIKESEINHLWTAYLHL